MRWIEDLFASIDEMDAEKFVAFMTDDAQFRYGSNEPTVGKSAIGEYVRQFFGMFKRLRHQLIGSWSHPDAIFIQGEVTYVKPDGSELTLPFLNCFKMRGDKIHEYLIYIDPTPLMG
jgi:ketosteroid isomerase-like protein